VTRLASNHFPEARQTHGGTTWLPTAVSVAPYFDDLISKASKTLIKLTVLWII